MVEWSSRGAAIHLEILVLHEREEVEGSGTLQMAACLPHTELHFSSPSVFRSTARSLLDIGNEVRATTRRDLGSLRLPRNDNDATMLDMMVKGSN